MGSCLVSLTVVQRKDNTYPFQGILTGLETMDNEFIHPLSLPKENAEEGIQGLYKGV